MEAELGVGLGLGMGLGMGLGPGVGPGAAAGSKTPAEGKYSPLGGSFKRVIHEKIWLLVDPQRLIGALQGQAGALKQLLDILIVVHARFDIVRHGPPAPRLVELGGVVRRRRDGDTLGAARTVWLDISHRRHARLDAPAHHRTDHAVVGRIDLHGYIDT